MLTIIPSGNSKAFMGFIAGLLLTAMLIGPFLGEGLLDNLRHLTMELNSPIFHEATAEVQGGAPWATEGINLQEKGSQIMREQMERQTNSQLSSLLSLMAGIEGAQVATQINSKGELNKVIVQVQVDSKGKGNGPRGNPHIQPVKRVTLGERAPVATAEADHEQLARRVLTWVSGYCGVGEDRVLVNIME